MRAQREAHAATVRARRETERVARELLAAGVPTLAIGRAIVLGSGRRVIGAEVRRGLDGLRKRLARRGDADARPHDRIARAGARSLCASPRRQEVEADMTNTNEKVLRRVRREVETEEWIEPRSDVDGLGEVASDAGVEDEVDDDDAGR